MTSLRYPKALSSDDMLEFCFFTFIYEVFLGTPYVRSKFYWGRGGRGADTLCTSLPPYEQSLHLPTPYFNIFMEEFLNDHTLFKPLSLLIPKT